MFLNVSDFKFEDEKICGIIGNEGEEHRFLTFIDPSMNKSLLLNSVDKQT